MGETDWDLSLDMSIAEDLYFLGFSVSLCIASYIPPVAHVTLYHYDVMGGKSEH